MQQTRVLHGQAIGRLEVNAAPTGLLIREKPDDGWGSGASTVPAGLDGCKVMKSSWYSHIGQQTAVQYLILDELYLSRHASFTGQSMAACSATVGRYGVLLRIVPVAKWWSLAFSKR